MNRTKQSPINLLAYYWIDYSMDVEEVFTPYSFPLKTYVKQEEKNLEQKVERILKTPGSIISLAGPSKSGKTVLLEKVVDDEYLIVVQGSGIDSATDLWESVLDSMDVPESTEEHRTSGSEVGGEVSGGADVGVPGLFKGSAKGTGQAKLSADSSTIEKYDRSGLQKVVEDLEGNNYVILIDDFHYLTRDAQSEIAEVIKEAARRGISICVALVPHRSDDIVRGNPDLRGRVQTLDIGYWNKGDLSKIMFKGGTELNVEFSPRMRSRFAEEAAGSPQLMQLLCLQACRAVGIDGYQYSAKVVDLPEDQIQAVFSQAVELTNHESTFDVLNSGPETRGTERNEYEFKDGTTGDVYKCILRAIASDPPKRSFEYEELKERTEEHCAGDSPDGSSIIRSCEQIVRQLEKRLPDEHALDWDKTKRELHIPDPYLLFYLRWSDKLNIH